LQGGEDNNPNAADEPGYWMGVQEIAIAADWERWAALNYGLWKSAFRSLFTLLFRTSAKRVHRDGQAP
jgi:hypothetical protein